MTWIGVTFIGLKSDSSESEFELKIDDGEGMVLSKKIGTFMGWSGSILVFRWVGCSDLEIHVIWLFSNGWFEENSPITRLDSSSITCDI